MSQPKQFVPFVSSNTDMPEFTGRALAIGLVMSVVLGAANAYLGLKAGMTIAATYPAAVIGMALIKLMKGSILEENFARTVGSIGESVAAGATFTIPAFFISGIWPQFFTTGHYFTSFLIMLVGGVLGIMFVALLRRIMVDDTELPFPESVAAAEIHKAGRSGGSGTKFLFNAMGVGAVIQALVQLKLFATVWEKFIIFSKTSIGLGKSGTASAQGGILLSSPGISPAYMGVGYIIGPKLSSLNFSGGVIAWGLLVPIITYFLVPSLFPDGAPVKEETWSALAISVWRFIVRPIAIGGMLMGAGFTLFKMRKSLVAGIARSVSDVKKAASGEVKTDRIDQDLKFQWLMVGVFASAVATFFITWMIFQTSILVAIVASVVMVIAGFFFAAVSGYLVGIIGSSNNPISGLTLTALVVTALVMIAMGVQGQEGVAAVLGVAAIVCVSAAVAGEMLQDLKAGHILGGTPWKMQMGDIVGVVVAAAVMFLPLVLLHIGDINDEAAEKLREMEKNSQLSVTYTGARPEWQGKTFSLSEIKLLQPEEQKELLDLDAGFGSKNIAAPQAGLMAMLSRGIVEGKMAWPLIVVGMLMGLGFILMQVRSPMLVSVGMYLPLETTFAIFLGGIIKGVTEMVVKRRKYNEAQRIRVENVGVLLAAGLIAGEALVGLLFASLKFFKIPYEIFENPSSFFISVLILVGIAVFLVRVPAANAGDPDAPPPPSANF